MEMVATVLNNKLYARVTSLYSLPNESNGYTAAAAPAYLLFLYYLFSFRQSRQRDPLVPKGKKKILDVSFV